MNDSATRIGAASSLDASSASRSVLPIAFAVIAAVFGFLPLASWFPGGETVDGYYARIAGEWLTGSFIVAGATVVLVILSGRIPALWREGLLRPLVDWSARQPVLFGALASVLAFVVYLAVAWGVFDGRPLTIDELVQVIQARIFARGELWTPASPAPEFFSTLHMLEVDGRYFAQFPPGAAALLAVGYSLGATWIVNPLCGAVSVAGFWSFLQIAEQRTAVRVGATLLFALAPFTLFMTGSHMNHVPALMCIVLGTAALARVVSSEHPRPGLAFLSGLAFGAIATIRPMDAVAFSLPAGIWYLLRAVRQPARWSDLLASGIGVAIPVGLMLWINAQMTGDPFLFGYQVLWGKSHNPGFHNAPWGIVHTPMRGLELINLYSLRLQTYFLESPVPALVPFIGALLLTRTVDAFDRLLFASAALLCALYFTYWFDGFLFGPRFFFPLLPFFALWIARLPGLVRERLGNGWPRRGIAYAYLVSAGMAAFISVPLRVREHATEFASMRVDYTAPAREAGTEHALIFVRESWGSQLIARLWRLGVPRSESEAIYRSVDACVLEESISALERSAVRDSAAFRVLELLMRDASRTTESPYSPDRTERFHSDAIYTPRCRQRILDDRAGFTLLAPLLYQEWGSNVYARDLHDSNPAIVRQYPGRKWFLLRPSSGDAHSPLQLTRIDADSARRAWEVPDDGEGRAAPLSFPPN